MKIEIAEPGRMTQSGSSLLKLIQNNNMPILDLLVRESIQNSLDAKNEKDPYVTVEFITGEFKKEQLNYELEGITESLNKKYFRSEYKYIAVRDSNTVGLTGKLHYSEVIDNQYGNLLKLIYEISKPQEAEGAGGSWGLGKTVYFRVGIGLVLYYSRIINENGEYESRLAASLVEDEMKSDSLIPVLNGKSKRGIAWWGQEIGSNKTKPVTDQNYILNILNIFKIKPYEANETGTTIIIPYVDDRYLLSNNQIEYKDGEEHIIQPFWRSNLEDYIRIAIQRWYAPRLNNKNYKNGKYLRAKVNQKGITVDNMEPAFQVVQALYNRAIKVDVPMDILDTDMAECKVEKIALRKVLTSTDTGTIAFAKLSRTLMRTGYPDNKPEPYMYYNCEIKEKDKNKPVISFIRKPGMIVSYEDVGSWVDGINSTKSDEFIFGIFVLNSDNQLSDEHSKMSLEEYVRKSEMADHTAWGDFSIGNFNPRIVSKIQTQVNSKISKEFSTEEEAPESRLNSGLGKMIGDLLLPPENFGKKASAGTKKGTGDSNKTEKHKHILFTLDSSATKYTSQGIELHLHIKSRGKIKTTGFDLEIDSEAGAISVQHWENKMGMDMPFEIIQCNINIIKIDGDNQGKEIIVDKNTKIQTVDDIYSELLISEKGYGKGVHFSFIEEHYVELEISVFIHLYRKDIKPLIKVEKEEGER